jgi:uncharacterized protein YacL
LKRFILPAIIFILSLFLGHSVVDFFFPNLHTPLSGLALGAALGCLVLLLYFLCCRIQLSDVLGALGGLLLGLVVAHLFTWAMSPLPWSGGSKNFVQVLLNLVFGLLGVLLAAHYSREWSMAKFIGLFKEKPTGEIYKILDTSVIIDGRIADVSETGFLDGIFIIPQFILKELQHIADSPDPLKRNRGRRGLDILNKIQKKLPLEVRIHDLDFPEIREVDAKLIALAKVIAAKIVTNDFNLNKVAELQGVAVLNVNELANALKPVVLPGEDMKVYILKEGKEYNQGVAYLDDGTMVVVDNGRRLIGHNAEVCVTSVLQTTAGRMIFTKLKEDGEGGGH